MCQGFSHFFRFFASFCIGQINHQQHKGYKHLNQRYIYKIGIFLASQSTDDVLLRNFVPQTITTADKFGSICRQDPLFFTPSNRRTTPHIQDRDLFAFSAKLIGRLPDGLRR